MSSIPTAFRNLARNTACNTSSLVIGPLIFKKGSDDDRQPLNYRGITLISVPCKIYCNILNHRLSSWLENNNILCDEQNGFHRVRSCEEHIHSLYTILNDRVPVFKYCYSDNRSL
jgi:hypothetical protein